MSTITSLVKLPVRLTFGTVTLVARTGCALAGALLREQSGAPPTEDDIVATAQPGPVEWPPPELDDEAEPLAPFPSGDARADPAGVGTQGEDDGRSGRDVDATGAAAAPPPVDQPVSEEPVVVAEVAEPGAEEGAGAEVSIEEPLPGYHAMKAADIIDWLQTAGAAEVAVAELYERAHRGRKSVLAAAERRMKTIQMSPRRN